MVGRECVELAGTETVDPLGHVLDEFTEARLVIGHHRVPGSPSLRLRGHGSRLAPTAGTSRLGMLAGERRGRVELLSVAGYAPVGSQRAPPLFTRGRGDWTYAATTHWA